MVKVFLLLRNNKQSGPHSLEELVQTGLKPLDLIWVEGKSFSWAHPHEITALKPYVSALPDTASLLAKGQLPLNTEVRPIATNNMLPVKDAPLHAEASPRSKVYVSLPANHQRTEKIESRKREANITSDKVAAMEQHAERLTPGLQSSTPKRIDTIEQPLVTKYSSSIPEREEAYTSWIYDNVKKSNQLAALQKNWAAIAIGALLVIVAGYGISQNGNENKVPETTTAAAVASTGDLAAEPLISEPGVPVTQPITEMSASENAAIVLGETTSKKTGKNSAQQTAPTLPEKHKAVALSGADKKLSVGRAPLKPLPQITLDEGNDNATTSVVTKKVDLPATTTKKKRSLNEKVDAFFSKFSRKKETAAPSEKTPETNKEHVLYGTAERKAVYRNEKAPASEPAVARDLGEFVDITTNKPAETWMLGVHGLKISLHNRSSETLAAAEVELRYYSEQNEIIEKKIVNFNNIAPGKTVTLAAPDHRLADHADYRLVAAR